VSGDLNLSGGDLEDVVDRVKRRLAETEDLFQAAKARRYGTGFHSPLVKPKAYMHD